MFRDSEPCGWGHHPVSADHSFAPSGRSRALHLHCQQLHRQFLHQCFTGCEVSGRLGCLISSGFPAAISEENVYIDIVLSSRQSMASQSSGMLWQTIQLKPGSLSILADMTHSRRSRYILGRVLTHTFTDLLPVTKYEICVTLKNQVPRNGQCIVFVTGSDFNEMQQREKLIHIVIIVLAMVLAVPAGMYACTTDAKFNCFERCTEMWRNRRHLESSHTSDERNGTFDSLQAASDEGSSRSPAKSRNLGEGLLRRYRN